MHESHDDKLNPNHPEPVGRLKLEVVDLTSQGVVASSICFCGTICMGSFADEE